MSPTHRREFLTDVGRGMLAVGLGSTLAADLGFSTAYAGEATEPMSFGAYDPLIDLLQSTPADQLQPVLVQKLQRGETDLRTLIAAAALANAETFGGQDYVGFHTAMAMLPAFEMTRLLPSERQPLPVLKVLYRNSQQIQQLGGASIKTLMAIHAAEHQHHANLGEEIRDASRRADMDAGETLFSELTDASLDETFNALQPAVQDDVNVHRFVFAHRTRGLANLLGKEYAHTLLRQCVRFCVDNEQQHKQHNHPDPEIRSLMPKLLDQYHLDGQPLGKRDPGDTAVELLANTIYNGPPDRSADAVAAALAERIDPEVVGEAISLASNALVLRQGADKWRTHGDAAGVHSSDATNAWRNMARVTDARHAASGLILAAYHTAQMANFPTPAYPTEEQRASIKSRDAAQLIAEAEDAVRNNDQGRAAAAIQVYGEAGHAPEAVFQSMLQFAVSEDGRLHGEKYFHTVREEFATTRPAFRWRQLVALARVNASAYGYNRDDQHGFKAAGYEEACKLLGVAG
ncbi:MAG: hypothetical protein SGJ19_25200 [Planctomycetia bacterium]|nr:hypothetical protein [Planctomycetia bacterium]